MIPSTSGETEARRDRPLREPVAELGEKRGAPLAAFPRRLGLLSAPSWGGQTFAIHLGFLRDGGSCRVPVCGALVAVGAGVALRGAC